MSYGAKALIGVLLLAKAIKGAFSGPGPDSFQAGLPQNSSLSWLVIPNSNSRASVTGN